MKATEFCKWFDFTLDKGEFYDEDGVDWKYCATDDQGIFANRYTDNVEELADVFDSCLQDYVDEDLEYNGFDPDNYEPSQYYLSASRWCEEESEMNDTFLHHIVRVLAGLEKLEDDVEVVV